jgi:uncharacterized protein DUF1844
LSSFGGGCYHPRRGEAGTEGAVAETKDHGKSQEIRVIDRRTFTSDGERRHPDAPTEEPEAPPQQAPGRPDRRETPGGAPGAPPTREEQVASGLFKNLILNLATTAAANLGEIPNPFSREKEVDLEGARQVIDLLQSLRLKTRGNLTPEETELLDSLLYDLRTKFVSLQKKAAKSS